MDRLNPHLNPRDTTPRAAADAAPPLLSPSPPLRHPGGLQAPHRRALPPARARLQRETRGAGGRRGPRRCGQVVPAAGNPRQHGAGGPGPGPGRGLAARPRPAGRARGSTCAAGGWGQAGSHGTWALGSAAACRRAERSPRAPSPPPPVFAAGRSRARPTPAATLATSPRPPGARTSPCEQRPQGFGPRMREACRAPPCPAPKLRAGRAAAAFPPSGLAASAPGPVPCGLAPNPRDPPRPHTPPCAPRIPQPREHHLRPAPRPRALR
jgi:hypothetical protein